MSLLDAENYIQITAPDVINYNVEHYYYRCAYDTDYVAKYMWLKNLRPLSINNRCEILYVNYNLSLISLINKININIILPNLKIINLDGLVIYQLK
jgi:hypothetical protein